TLGEIGKLLHRSEHAIIDGEKRVGTGAQTQHESQEYLETFRTWQAAEIGDRNVRVLARAVGQEQHGKECNNIGDNNFPQGRIQTAFHTSSTFRSPERETFQS